MQTPRYPKHVVKIDTQNTPWGEVAILLIDGQRTIAFPELIDDSDAEQLDGLWQTFCWPLGATLEYLPDFEPGPPLAGWDILGAYRGECFADPAVDDVIDDETTPSLLAAITSEDLQERFVFAFNQCKQNTRKQSGSQ